ncbi:MAG: hypothetical protein JEZ09_03075 [Salinivirgaceae bacterium]|nr:hypothetical protein [Salinivirgaceae bacterium]
MKNENFKSINNQSVAIQGGLGAFHKIAARKYFGAAIKAVPCQTFEEITQSMAGFRVGMVAGKSKFINHVLKIKSNMDSGSMYKLSELLQRIDKVLVTKLKPIK